MDGVMQAPGGPEEDISSGFKYGGWSYHYWDKQTGDVMDGFMKMPFELLLGRKTYDIFAAYWPTAKTDNEVAVPFNKTKKYVVSHKNLKLAWNNSELVTGDVVEKIRALKKMDGPDLWVHGSGNLIQTLLKHDLIDCMHIWTVPVTAPGGKRLFVEGTQPRSWKLVHSTIAENGVITATYEPAGELKVGTIGESEAAAK